MTENCYRVCAVFTSVMRKVDGKWMVVQGHRSTGRKPSDPQPQF